MLYYRAKQRGERLLGNAFFTQEEATLELPSHSRIPPPIPATDLIISANGVDLLYKDKKRPHPFQYEDTCFAQVTKRGEADNFFLGPHLIDVVFALGFHGICRPDTIRFQTTGPEWTIAELFEFKSGKRIKEVTRKLEGFATLLRKMRQNVEYLPGLLKTALPQEVAMPNQITIPDDPEIAVTFVSPLAQNETIFFQSAPRFRVGHMQVPAS